MKSLFDDSPRFQSQFKGPPGGIPFYGDKPTDIIQFFNDWMNKFLESNYGEEYEDIEEVLQYTSMYIGEESPTIKLKEAVVRVSKTNKPQEFKPEVTPSRQPLSSFDGIEINFKCAIYFVISRKQTLLADIYEKAVLHKNAVMILVEDNTGDLTSSAKYYIKTGRDVAISFNGDSAEVIAKRLLENEDVEIPKDQIEFLVKVIKLIEDGNGEYDDPTTVQWIIENFTSLVWVLSTPLRLTNSGILWLLTSLAEGIEEVKAKPKGWNPAESKGDVFIPHHFPYMKIPVRRTGKMNDSSKKYELKTDNLAEGFKSATDKLKGYASNNFDLNPQALLQEYNIDSSRGGLILSMHITMMSETINIVNALVTEVLSILETLLVEGIVIVNAFISGFVNGILSLVKMLVQIVRAPFWLLDEFIALATDPEQLDEAISAVTSFNLGALFSKLGDFFVNLYNYFTSMDGETMSKVLGLSRAEWAYFSGAFLEFVGELVLGIIFTGGTVTGAAIVKEFLSIFTGLVKILKAIIVGFFKLTKKAVIGGAKLMARLLALTADELAKFFDEIFQAIKKYFDDFRRNSKKGTLQSGAYKSSKAKVVSKALDNAPKEIKKWEKILSKRKKEFAYYWIDGKAPLQPLTSGLVDEVRIPISKLKQLRNAIFTHNHPLSGSLSHSDIKLFLQFGLKEIRSVGKDGVVHSMKFVKKISSREKRRIVHDAEKYSKTFSKTENVTDANLLGRLEAEWLVRRLDGLVDYVKYID